MITLLKIRLLSIYSPMTIFGMAVTAVIVTSAGPFGAYEIGSFWWQLLFWSGVIVISAHLGVICQVMADHLVASHRPLLSDLTKVAMMAVVLPPVLLALVFAVRGHTSQAAPNFLKLMLYVVLVSAGISIVRRILPTRGGSGYFSQASLVTSPVTSPVTTQLPRLVRRMPEDARDPILRLTVHDHFVDVVTALDSHRLRMRFADAIEEMDTVKGYCTHRSHWVSKDAIAGVKREQGKTHLRLSNGDLVPVSRKFKPILEKAGVL